jgi:hypothetical protein
MAGSNREDSMRVWIDRICSQSNSFYYEWDPTTSTMEINDMGRQKVKTIEIIAEGIKSNSVPIEKLGLAST